MDERDELAAISLEEAAGISSPLYDIVDVLFELQSRGYFRRQVRRPLLAKYSTAQDLIRGGCMFVCVKVKACTTARDVYKKALSMCAAGGRRGREGH